MEPRFTNLIRSWRPFVTRNVRKPKLFFLLWSHGVLFNNIFKKPQNTMKFKRRHGKFEQGCELSESYTATDAVPPILPVCRQPLLPVCVFVTRDTVRHPRRFLFGKFVGDERRSWTEVQLYFLFWMFWKMEVLFRHSFSAFRKNFRLWRWNKTRMDCSLVRSSSYVSFWSELLMAICREKHTYW
jgi:hypothetical protein